MARYGEHFFHVFFAHLNIITYTFSSTKLEIRAEQVLPGSMEVGGKKRGWGQVGGMAQQCMHI
jgi:hypothetical protein